MEKISLKKIALASFVVLSLSSCNFMHYLKAITLDEGKSLLNTAYSAISAYDPNSKTEYSFSLLAEKLSGKIEDERVTDYQKVDGTFTYNVSSGNSAWQTFALSYTLEEKKEGEEAVINEYSVRHRTETEYEVSINATGGYILYVEEDYPFLAHYFSYSSSIYHDVSEKITSLFVEEINNVGTQGEEKTNNLYGYTFLSQGYGDVTVLLESWDFSILQNYISYADVFTTEEGLRNSYSSINFMEGYYENGLMAKFVVGYDSEIDEEMKNDGFEEKAKGIADSYRVTFTF